MLVLSGLDSHLACGANDRIQEHPLLFCRTIQLSDMVLDHIPMDAGNTYCQFTPAFFGLRKMDYHMEWSVFSCDTTHLPGYFSV